MDVLIVYRYVLGVSKAMSGSLSSIIYNNVVVERFLIDPAPPEASNTQNARAMLIRVCAAPSPNQVLPQLQAT
jgi:hypothetical protein